MTSHVSRMLQGLIRGAVHFASSFSGTFRSSNTCIAILAVVGFASSAAAQNGSLPALQRIDRSRLCVTNGIVSTSAGDQLTIDTPSSRAIVQAGSDNAGDQIAEIHFQYLGPSQDSRLLASGELRRQIGLKLRAQDSCNLIYAVWRIDADSRVVVSIKRNAGLRTHAQCGAHGYSNFKPQGRGDLPPILAGEVHKLRAELHGKELTITADGKIAWQGSLGNETALPVGPPGFRTDNARFKLEYFAAVTVQSEPTAQQAPLDQGHCVISDGD